MATSSKIILGQHRPPGSPLDPSGVLRRRPLFWLALAFCTGIVLDDLLGPSLPALGGLALTGLLTTLAALLLVPASGRILLAVSLLCGITGGALRHAAGARFLPAEDVSRRTGSAAALTWLEGTLVEAPHNGESSRRELWILDLEGLGSEPDHISPTSGRIQLSVRNGNLESSALAEGDRVRLLARLEVPRAATLPDGFDYATYLDRQGIRRVGEVSGDSVQHLGSAGAWRLDLKLRRWGGDLAQRNVERFGPDHAALLNALLLGRREGLDTSDREAFSKAGTAHLLAISGLHVQAVAGLLLWFLCRFGLSRRRAGIAVLLFAFGFGALVGGNPPVMRSVLMIGTYVAALLFRRQPDPLTTLGASALLILLIHPDDLFTAGFQLSFLAVLALVTLFPTLEAAWRLWRGLPEEWIVDPEEQRYLRWRRGARHTLFISLASWLGTAPVVAWHMGYFTLLSLGTNLIAVPLSMVGMATGALLMLPGTDFCSGILLAPLTLLMGFNRWVAEWPWTSLDVPAPPFILCAVYVAVLVWAWVSRGRSATGWKLVLLLPAALFALIATTFFRGPPLSSRITVFDLPRGRSALVETPSSETALIDCGAEGQGLQIAESLRRQGHRTLALLIITEDAPEALGGAEELLEHLKISRVILPHTAVTSLRLRALIQSLTQLEIPYGPVESGGAVQGPGDVHWEFGSDAPEARPGYASNEALSVRVAVPGVSLLFVNARSGAALKRLLEKSEAPLKAEVLRITPGQGGRWPLETALLVDRCGAKFLLAGEGRGLPEEGTGLDLSALAQVKNLRLVSTQREGSLRFGASGAELPEAYRQGRWQVLERGEKK